MQYSVSQDAPYNTVLLTTQRGSRRSIQQRKPSSSYNTERLNAPLTTQRGSYNTERLKTPHTTQRKPRPLIQHSVPQDAPHSTERLKTPHTTQCDSRRSIQHSGSRDSLIQQCDPRLIVYSVSRAPHTTQREPRPLIQRSANRDLSYNTACLKTLHTTQRASYTTA